MTEAATQRARTSGVLLHPTALPDSPVCGTFGEPSRRWLHQLANSGIGVWQMLPLSPPDPTGSPYSSPSCFALNAWLLDASDLANEQFISHEALNGLPGASSTAAGAAVVDFQLANQRSNALADALLEAWPQQTSERHEAFRHWCSQQSWLDDHVSFSVLHAQHNNAWWTWPKPLAQHQRQALKAWAADNQAGLMKERLMQWQLDRQWQEIRRLAQDLGVVLFGDLPFYVSTDSADVWSHRNLFTVKESGELTLQSGVPPDYFSETGQLWGSPVYRWGRHRITRFRWWRNRISRQRELVDLLRLDHFRALAAFWAVPGGDTTAQNGQWQSSPGHALLAKLQKDAGGDLPLIAEDLGVITPDVEDLRDQFALPGMKVLQFAFDGQSDNPYLPENMDGSRWVVYTGTHDNPTTLGWWQRLDSSSRERITTRINGEVSAPAWHLFDMAFATPATLVVAPLQDLMHLDDRARFNTPGTCTGNWNWRLSQFDNTLEGSLKGFGERAKVWGRNLESATALLNHQ